MDVIAVHQAGLPFAVATLGTATSTTHIERIFRSVPDIIFCFDGDNAGRKAAWRALESALPALKEGVSASFLFLPEDDDPDSLIRAEGAQAFSQRLRTGLPLADFLFNHLSTDLRLDSLEGKSRLASLAKPLIEKVPVGVYRQLLWQRLSQLTGLDELALKQAMPSLAVNPVEIDLNLSDEPPIPATRPVRRPYLVQPEAPALRSVAGRSSLSDKAIQLLLQKSTACQALDLTTLAEQLPPNTALLQQVIAYCQQHPDCTSYAILGAWEGTPEGAHLKALAEDAAFIPALNVEAELNDIFNQLRVQAIKNQLAQSSDLATTMRLNKELRALTAMLAKK